MVDEIHLIYLLIGNSEQNLLTIHQSPNSIFTNSLLLQFELYSRAVLSHICLKSLSIFNMEVLLNVADKIGGPFLAESSGCQYDGGTRSIS